MILALGWSGACCAAAASWPAVLASWPGPVAWRERGVVWVSGQRLPLHRLLLPTHHPDPWSQQFRQLVVLSRGPEHLRWWRWRRQGWLAQRCCDVVAVAFAAPRSASEAIVVVAVLLPLLHVLPVATLVSAGRGPGPRSAQCWRQLACAGRGCFRSGTGAPCRCANWSCDRCQGRLGCVRAVPEWVLPWVQFLASFEAHQNPRRFGRGPQQVWRATLAGTL